MGLIYIHRIEEHDLTHQFGLQKKQSKDLFELDPASSYDGIKFEHKGCVYLGKHLGATDPRLGGGFKKILDLNNAQVGDFVVFRKKRVAPYQITITKNKVAVGSQEYSLQLVVDVGDKRHFMLEFNDCDVSESKPPVPPNVDRLSVALELFKKNRTTWKVQNKNAYEDINLDVRKYYGDASNWNLEKLSTKEGFSDFCVMHTWMMSNGSGSWSSLCKYTDEQRELLLGWIDKNVVKLESSPGEVIVKDNGFVGFTNKAVTELLMKFHPDKYCLFNSPTMSVFRFLDLVDWEIKGEFEYGEYLKIMEVFDYLKKRLDEIGVRAIDGEEKPADYITVNEFIYFVATNMDLIKEKIMSKKLKTIGNEVEPGDKDWKDVLTPNPDDIINRLILSLLVKPFAILAGASGTGKSRMVRKLAYMTCHNPNLKPDPSLKNGIGNFKMVQVKPNWHDSSELLGYRSAVSDEQKYVSTDFVRFVLKAHAVPDTPFFVCLDEMNLAPVEHYFAEFLSASESARVENGEFITDPIIEPGEFGNSVFNLEPECGIPEARKALIEKHGLYIPKNLFVVGTVNMDDTTSGFSRKVLDRAMTIEMDKVDFGELQSRNELVLEDVKDADGNVIVKGLLMKAAPIAKFIERIDFDCKNLDDGFKDKLEKIRKTLETSSLAFAYRFARECVQYRDALKELFPDAGGGDGFDYADCALDHMFLMKILPRLVGNADDRVKLLQNLETFFGGLNCGKLSKVKLGKMRDAAAMNGGFLSYWP